MVTIITEKLRSQKLDDVQFEPIPQVTRKSWELTTVGLTSLANPLQTDKKEWFVSPVTAEGNREHGERSVKLAAIGQVTTRQRHASLETARHHVGCHQKLPAGSTMLFCDRLSSTPPAPPLKRHCRSLSIPGDRMTGNQGNDVPPSNKTWQPQASTIWKPVALRPHFREPKLIKSRNSPLGLVHHKNRHSSGPGGLCNVTPRNPSPGASSGTPGSADSGTGQNGTDFSGYGFWSVASSDSFSTPPESPVPRPASASSGFYDSSQSSLNGVWLDSLNVSNNNATSHNQRANTFKVRSFSMEEPISNVAIPGGSTPTAGSMPVIPSISTPSSPRRYRVPRCRSQPCDLHDRKCGLKRRRDDDRPTLDFFKMKETAYDRTARMMCGRPKSVQFAEQELRSGRILPSIFSEPPECFLGLNTIASSPLDNVLPILVANAQLTSPGGASSTAEAHTRSEHADRPRRDAPGAGCRHPADLLGDVFPDVDPLGRMIGRSLATAASRDGNHSDSDATDCDEEPTGSGADDKGEADDDDSIQQVFQLDMNNELDLEQIEKD